MYPPPSQIVLNKLLGHTVELVSIGQFVLHIGFVGGDMLSITAPFRFGQNAPLMEFPLEETRIASLPGLLVNGIQCDPDGTLYLDFADGRQLVVYANDPQYEAYTLRIDTIEYVV